MRWKSFVYAVRGLVAGVKGERHLKVHIFAAVGVTVAGFWFGITALEWALVALCIGMVLAAELINTALERLSDFVQPKHDVRIGQVKDIAAGAVLVLALAALVVATLVFWPYLRGGNL
jgi:diacylglycerol kinase (ATP)